MMPSELYPDPSLEDQRRTLLTFYFGRSRPLTACVARAYRDFNRTLHGMRKITNREALTEAASRRVQLQMHALAHTDTEPDQAWFDGWHRDSVQELIAIYQEHGYSAFTVGQAQKWLNMTFKYLQCYGEDDVPGYRRWYPFAHVPIDNVLLQRLDSEDRPGLGARWSRLDDYGTYMRFQEWFRRKFEGASPLAVEFRMWIE